MQHHHRAEEPEDRRRREAFGRHREEERHERREHPMGGRTERLSLRPEALREDLADENPDDRPLPEPVGREEDEDAGRRQGTVPRREEDGRGEEGCDVADAAALEGVKTELPISPWNTLVPAPDAETSARLLTAAKSISAVWQTEFRNGRVLQENALFRTVATYRPHRLLLRADQALPDADLCIMLMAALAAGCELQLSTATMRPWMQNMLYPAGVDIAVETRQTYEGRLPALAEQGICVRDPAATESTRTAAAACGLELIPRPAAANGHAELPCCVQELVETRRGNAPATLL